MPAYREIRANFDRDSIVVYQAYGSRIAEPTLKAGRFVTPFSWQRMTWIKPSFLWLMARSNWGQKSGQERILAIRISRAGWERALALATLTSFDPQIHESESGWRAQFESSKVHVQWDPERSLRGQKLQHRSIQVGLSREIIREYTDQWVREITDLTPLVRKIHSHCRSGNQKGAKQLLPSERVYRVPEPVARRLGI